MTKPDLMAELAEVVRLSERATPGPWTWSENGNILGHMPNGYDSSLEVGAIYTERDDDKAPANAEAIIAAVNFLRTHHAELEAAERDARRYRFLRDIDRDGWPAVRVPCPCPDNIKNCRTHHTAPKRGDALDAAIDATQEGEG
jgi:hypothetical protein